MPLTSRRMKKKPAIKERERAREGDFVKPKASSPVSLLTKEGQESSPSAVKI